MPGVLKAEMTEYSQVPGVPTAEMTEYLRIPRVPEDEVPEYARVPGVSKAEIAGWYSVAGLYLGRAAVRVMLLLLLTKSAFQFYSVFSCRKEPKNTENAKKKT